MVRASASSPLPEPPWRMMSPTPTPTNSAPASAAASGWADRSGSMGGNCSHTLYQPDTASVAMMESRMKPPPRKRKASR